MSESSPAQRRRRNSPPLPLVTRSALGGLEVVARRGTRHMAAIGALGAAGLDSRIADEAGIPADAPDYEVRLAAARKAYFIRLAAKASAARKVASRRCR